jgi:hypothetical protein
MTTALECMPDCNVATLQAKLQHYTAVTAGLATRLQAHSRCHAIRRNVEAPCQHIATEVNRKMNQLSTNKDREQSAPS